MWCTEHENVCLYQYDCVPLYEDDCVVTALVVVSCVCWPPSPARSHCYSGRVGILLLLPGWECSNHLSGRIRGIHEFLLGDRLTQGVGGAFLHDVEAGGALSH